MRQLPYFLRRANNSRPVLFIIALSTLALIFAVGTGAKLKTALFDDPAGDIGVTKTGPDTAAADTNVTYTITVTTFGPDDVIGAQLTDNLPGGMTFVSLDTSGAPGWSCSDPGAGNNGQVACSISSSSIGDSVFSLTVHIAAETPPGTFFTNIATVSGSPNDNPENDSSTATTQVPSNEADLIITKTGPGQFHADADVSYTITVSNVGSNTATNASFTDKLPGTMTFVSFNQNSGTPWNCGSPSATTSCSLASLPAGATGVFTFVGHVPPGTAEGTTYTNSATISSDNDPNAENNSSSTTGTVFSCFTDVVVTTNADSGAGSLRQAVLDVCPGGTIQFDMSSVVSPIALTSDELLVNKDLTINGPGAGVLTVQRSNAGGTPNFRVLEISSSASTVNISGLTIANGHSANGAAGGGILNNSGATLNLVSVVVDSNSAGSAGSGEGAVGGYGGGISNVGTLTLTNCTVSNNQAGIGTLDGNSGGGGGGIANGDGSNSGNLTITNSTISNNHGADGSVTGGAGGGIANNASANATLINSTISGNKAGASGSAAGANGGGIADSGSSLFVINCTIANNQTGAGTPAGGNGGGIFSNNGNLRNTIVAGNTFADAGQGADLYGTFTSQDNNLIGDTNGSSITGATSHNIYNQPAKLGPLANNGGPTQTHALLPGSPAFDAGDNCVTDSAHCGDSNFSQLDNDQRGVGFARSVDGPDADTTDTVDIGAFEAQVSLADITDKTTNEDVPLQFDFLIGGNVTSITATSSNTAVAPDPSVSGSGSTRTLTINPVANQFGTTTITVTVSGNNAQSMTDTFLLTVNSLNDAPSFTKGPDQSVNEDSGAQTVANWATNISPGPEDESSQTVAFQIIGNTNPALFSAGPALSPTGTLTYTPAPNANGTAAITITLMDNGGTANGGQDTSAPQTFNITINPIPDTPAVSNASTTVNAQTTSGLVITRNSADGAEVTHFKITNITGGTLFKNNGTTQINNNDFITFAEGNAGLKFTPALNSTSDGSFQVQASTSNTNAGLGGGTATATISIACGPTVVANSNNSGAGSLRDTILHACTSATITFDMTPGHVTSPINLTTAELLIDKSLVVQGPRADVLTVQRSTAAGTPLFRVFNITTSVGAAISGLTISNGNGGFQGGGISNSNNSLLTLDGVVVSNNTAQFGGGVFNFGNGNVAVLNSTISGNNATNSGGGLYNNATGFQIVSIANSTIFGNTAGAGGGIFNVQAHLNIVNATIANNSAPGVAGAGGGIYNNSPTAPAGAIGNTIVAGNTAGTPNGPDIQGAMSSLGNNLIGAKDGSSGLTNGVSNDIVGTIANPINPLLAPIGNYGGPTPTMALLPGSPAINAGSNSLASSSGLTTDQRGPSFNRVVGAAVDIGAFESRGFTISAFSGTPQSATILTAFASPLVASITGVGVEPVNGGVIRFTAPGSGASAALTGGSATANITIAGGQASTNATANGIGGAYNVTASATGASSASFALTNSKAATSTTVTSSVNPSDLNQSVTFTATVTGPVTPTGTVQFKDNGGNLGSPVALNGSGVAQVTTLTLTTGNHTITADYSGDGNLLTSTGTLAGGQTVRFRPLIKFSQPTYSVNENGNFITINVIRFGDTSSPVTVDYATPDDSAALVVLPCSTANGVASPRCDFTTAIGTLRFAAGETTKSFNVLVSQDLWVEGNETAQLTLSNPTGGAAFQQPSDALSVLTIVDDDSTPPSTNAIDDSNVFVRQQYHDFLNREPDSAGFNFWVSQIESCGADAACRAVKRNNVSAAFFLSIEFQNTGYFVERMYKTAYGDIAPPVVPVPVRFTNFIRDSQQIRGDVIVGIGDWQTQLDNNKKAFALNFVQRPEFINRYPGLTAPSTFVETLNANAGNVLTGIEAVVLTAKLSADPANPLLRADVLLTIAENDKLKQSEFNRAFVLMQYFGYLRRNPDAAPEPTLNFNGYNFWLTKLNQANGDYIGAEMIKGFITSGEYRGRFGP